MAHQSPPDSKLDYIIRSSLNSKLSLSLGQNMCLKLSIPIFHCFTGDKFVVKLDHYRHFLVQVLALKFKECFQPFYFQF